MQDITSSQQTELEAAAFRHLLTHLDNNKDVQNIDLMILADFCRNCLSKWMVEAAEERGISLDYETARQHVYGMPYNEWKQKYQQPATEAQLAALAQREAEKTTASQPS